MIRNDEGSAYTVRIPKEGEEAPPPKDYSRGKNKKTSDINGLEEEQIKEFLSVWLKENGWDTKIAWGKEHGIDILAIKDTQKWIIEVKGCGSLAAMRVNYFLSILGEILQRMDKIDAKYSIALPNMQQYRNLWKRLPALAKERTQISAIFISINGEILFDD